MELLYVWIEKYKNIEKQGFNFSPEHRFSFDDNTKTLRPDEVRSDKVIDKFFGDKISNITAIVGENGSGKSNLCEFLLQQYGGYRLLKEVETMCSFLIFRDNGNGVFYKYEDKIQIKSENFQLEPISELDNNYIHYSLHINKEESVVNTEKDISNYANLWSSPFSKNKISINDYHVKDILTILKFLLFVNNRGFNLSGIKGFSYPSKMNITFNLKLKEILDAKFGEKKWEKHIITAYDFFTKCENIEAALFFTNMSQAEHFEDNLKEIEEKAQIILETTQKTSIGLDQLKELCNDFSFLKDSLKEIIEDLKYLGFDKKQSEISLKSKLDYGFHDKFTVFYSRYASLIEIQWEYSLATGFNNLLSFMSRCYIKARPNINKNLPLTIIIDEGETGLHPNLQKQYLEILREFLNHDFVFELKKGLKIQIILATHSPFILSDLPKENVVFLKNKEGKCEVQNGLVDIKQTFGANIHTLLSDGFFMGNSLIGEFARKKINEIIKKLNSWKKVKEKNEETKKKGGKIKDIKDQNQKIKNMIALIGEPIIAQKLHQMYDEIFEKNTEKEYYQKQIEYFTKLLNSPK